VFDMHETSSVESSPSKAFETGSASREKLPLVVCSTPLLKRKWRWFEPQYDGLARWEFYYGTPASPRIRRIPFASSLALTRSCWQAVRSAKRNGAKLLITHDPRVTFRTGFFQRMLGSRVPHVAWSFNFARLPEGRTRRLMAKGFAHVDRFIVFSSLERDLYHEAFGIPKSKLEMVYWGVGEPTVDQPETPIESGDYICAVGGNARDYPTLMAAMERIPEIPLAVVLRPHNLVGLKTPPNVRVHVDRPFGETNNIIKFSRFMVLPLTGTDVPCGHVTLVNAMLLNKAMVITNSSGVHDYIQEDVNAITCEANAPEALAARIRELWNDPARSERLGADGRRFAKSHCTEESMKGHLDRVLRDFGVLTA
jgi:glycosyltransferase involved in cell wall biosynthesis